MKMHLIASAAVLSVLGYSAAHACTIASLNGCYAHRNTSVATVDGKENVNGVGTWCFDGNGNVLSTSGATSNHYGKIRTLSNQTGTYTVDNAPASGMGTLVGPCNTHEISLYDIDANGLAHGFSYIVIKTNKGKGCDNQAVVSGGEAHYQGQ